jgi:hypothetical protein
MKHHGTLAGVVALTAALLIGSPASAGDPELKSHDLRRELREMREELAALRKMHRLADIELRLLNDRVSRIEESMARLSSPGVVTRGAGAFSPTVPVATGAIRLDNRLAVPATVVIDGVAYSVPAFSMRMLPGQPARMITYEVTALGFGVRAPVRTPVNANETLTLTIH